MPHYHIYTDGSCAVNPGGKGGAAAIIVCQETGCKREIAQGYLASTNNRMEILAVLIGLEAITDDTAFIEVFSDSQYVVNSIAKGWAKRWEKRGWWKGDGERAKNPDLWERVLRQTEKHAVQAHWIRGHAGHDMNERCDVLAGRAAAAPKLRDEGYDGR